MDFHFHKLCSHSGPRILRSGRNWVLPLLLLAATSLSARPCFSPLAPVASFFNPEGWNLHFASIIDLGSTTYLNGRRVKSTDLGKLLPEPENLMRRRDYHVLIYLGPPRPAKEVENRLREIMENSRSGAWAHWNLIIHPASFKGPPDYSLSTFPNVLARIERRAHALPGTWELIDIPTDLAVREIYAFGKNSKASLRSVQIREESGNPFRYFWRWKDQEPRNEKWSHLTMDRFVGSNASNFLLTLPGGDLRLDFQPDPKTGETFATLRVDPNLRYYYLAEGDEALPRFEVGPYRRVDPAPPASPPENFEPPPIEYRRDRIFERE